MGLHAILNQSSSGLEKEVVGFLEKKKGISIKKYRGQSYDSAATMSGVWWVEA